MNAYVRYCIKCGTAFDIDISKMKCPKCRREDIQKSEKEKGGDEEDGKI